MFDAMRFLAGVGVVWFHTVESPVLGSSGVLGRLSVSLFTIMGVVVLFEAVRKYPGRTLPEFAWRRVRRLYVPFLGWSAIIAAAALILHRFIPGIHPAAINLNTLVAGTAEPLWFIPFFVIGSILVFPLAKWIIGHPKREWTVAIVCAIAGAGLDWIPWNAPPFGHVPVLGRLLELSWNRWSAFYWGVALAVLFSQLLRGWRGSGLLAAGGFLLAAVMIIYQWHYAVVPGFKVLGGIGLAFVALAPLRGRVVTFLGNLAPLSFGMYLSHALWILLARAAAGEMGLALSWQRDVIVFLPLGASVISLDLFSRQPMGCWLVGLEKPLERRAVGRRITGAALQVGAEAGAVS